MQSRDLKNALSLLEEARCLYQVRHSSGQGLPLGVQTNSKKFKLLHLDVGLMQRALMLDAELHQLRLQPACSIYSNINIIMGNATSGLMYLGRHEAMQRPKEKT